MKLVSYKTQFLASLTGGIVRILDEIGRDLERDIKTHFTGAGQPKAKRRASLPGEPPAVQSGTLKGSITYEVDKTKLLVRVGTNLEYGKHLELGTHKMAARPYIRPSFERKRREIRKMFKGG